jgi:hypothetical protein
LSYNFQINKNVVTINFNKLVDILDIFILIISFSRDSKFIIKKILLININKSYKRYNDITDFMQKNDFLELHLFILKKMDNTEYHESSLLFFDEKSDFQIEITLQSNVDVLPYIYTRNEIIDYITDNFKKK